MDDVSEAVKALVGRMGSHPEEFFSDESKWRFMYLDTFRDVLTETEKGVIHAALKKVRREEFHKRVMTTIFRKAEEDNMEWHLQNRMSDGFTSMHDALGKYAQDKRTVFNSKK